MDVIEIGNAIERTRKELRLTQAQLAELAQMSTRPIYQVEDGHSIRLDSLLSLCEALGLEVIVKERGGMSLGRSQIG